MTIARIRPAGRKGIAWYEAVPPQGDVDLFTQRQFLVSTCTAEQLQEDTFLAGLAAVVFIQRRDKPLRIEEGLSKNAQRLLDHDCRVIIRGANSGKTILQNIIGKLDLPATGFRVSQSGDPPLPHLQVFGDSVPSDNIADLLLIYPPGPAPNAALAIEPESLRVKITEQREILIRRAFHDCSVVHLVPMKGSRSPGTVVYRAHAELAQGLEGKWPQPLFVKLGKRRKIFEEYQNYEGRVDPYIPFHLGPHLVADRCCLGAFEGLIVGDYVDGSECLTECACEDRASSAISCLFDRTLLGWHRRARREEGASIAKLLASLFPVSIPPERYRFAQALGATRDISQLRALFDRCDSMPVLVGPIHGDLHAKNVRVRGNDAIIIDFFANRDCPLLLDAAALEASLLVEGFGEAVLNVKPWMESVSRLYEDSPLNGIPVPANPKDSSAWFFSCVQQIRRYAREWEPRSQSHQYAAALAVVLLSKAAKDGNSTKPEGSRRAAAYVFAERILRAAFEATPREVGS